MVKAKDLVRHKKLGWIGQVREIENQQKACHYLSCIDNGKNMLRYMPWTNPVVSTICECSLDWA